MRKKRRGTRRGLGRTEDEGEGLRKKKRGGVRKKRTGRRRR